MGSYSYYHSFCLHGVVSDSLHICFAPSSARQILLHKWVILTGLITFFCLLSIIHLMCIFSFHTHPSFHQTTLTHTQTVLCRGSESLEEPCRQLWGLKHPGEWVPGPYLNIGDASHTCYRWSSVGDITEDWYCQPKCVEGGRACAGTSSMRRSPKLKTEYMASQIRANKWPHTLERWCGQSMLYIQVWVDLPSQGEGCDRGGGPLHPLSGTSGIAQENLLPAHLPPPKLIHCSMQLNKGSRRMEA